MASIGPSPLHTHIKTYTEKQISNLLAVICFLNEFFKHIGHASFARLNIKEYTIEIK